MIDSFQSDLGIEVILKLFSKNGLTQMFNLCETQSRLQSSNSERTHQLKNQYLQTIDSVISFLQGKLPTMAYQIASGKFLPKGKRFDQIDDLQWAFGTMGIQDKAKHFATLYLEDLGDYIQENIDPHFGFSRYAEKIGRCANQFDEIYEELKKPLSYIDEILISILEERITHHQPELVCLSVPFPGNLLSAFRIAQYIRKNHPHIHVAMGGGFANTELRSIKDKRVFEFFHFITLDDGEAPVENLLYYIRKQNDIHQLKRTFLLLQDELIYVDNPLIKDYKQGQVGCPDYSDLPLDQYIHVIEITNPMHSLWSNGRWNKLTMAHGCYWGKCTFCDISLDYIKRYEPLNAKTLCDRMETLIAQTGERGFHFVDEAAPPSLMLELALEIKRRQLVVTWWANIRFEIRFTRDLCLLLKESGCIGVSGGLEVASERILKLINKGITLEQVALVNKNFTEAGIMVHSYLMYGFPTQTAQETIDSLEMVRQMFKAGILQSGFWHQFTMTAHSPVGLDPERFGVKKANESEILFADNDVEHIDPTGADHGLFAFGLKKSLFNYMHGLGMDEPLGKWFDFKIPKTGIDPNFILSILNEEIPKTHAPHTRVIFTGPIPKMEIVTKSKKGNQWELAVMKFEGQSESMEIKVDKDKGEWLYAILPSLNVDAEKSMTIKELEESYEARGLEDFGLFWDNKPITQLYKVGLLHL
ncbi:MAG: hypothetical protein RL582_1363 [Bacteroidota bacterium]